MEHDSVSKLMGLILLFGTVMGIMLIAYDEGVPFGLFKKIKCRIGKHTYKVGFRKRRHKYFCKHCKKPRKHPALKAIDGGKIELSNFKF